MGRDWSSFWAHDWQKRLFVDTTDTDTVIKLLDPGITILTPCSVPGVPQNEVRNVILDAVAHKNDSMIQISATAIISCDDPAFVVAKNRLSSCD